MSPEQTNTKKPLMMLSCLTLVKFKYCLLTNLTIHHFFFFFFFFILYTAHGRVMDVSTDLTLGLGISLVSPRNLFVKVYLEGVPIGRKLNLSAYKDYNGLIQTLNRMFNTKILWPNVESTYSDSNDYLLTYEDKEGDWMLVGDIPWEMFLMNVKKLKITRPDNHCRSL